MTIQGCEVVKYYHNKNDNAASNGKVKFCPAFITSVHSDGSVNLKIFPDSCNDVLTRFKVKDKSNSKKDEPYYELVNSAKVKNHK